MRIKWHNIFALVAIIILIVILKDVGDTIGSFFGTLSENNHPRQRSPEQIVGAILFAVLFISGLYAINVYLNIKDK